MAVAPELVTWYRRERKLLPWREHPTPYRNWVAEVISQQTTLKVAVPRFERFVAELPDLESLAACDEERLAALWSGLGYYARARNLKAGARHILDRFPGRWPETRDEWLTVPGCGPYTAAVLASICAGEKVPSVDGNALRVVSRLEAITDDLWTPAGRDRVTRFLEKEIASRRDPGDFNQAVMELGQEICTRNRPACPLCPVSAACRALELDVIDRCPPLKPRKKPTDVELAVLILFDRGGRRIAVGRRRAGFLKGTVGFPIVDLRDRGSAELLESLGSLTSTGLERAATRPRHTITSHRLRLSVLSGTVAGLKEVAAAIDIDLRWKQRGVAIDGLATALDSRSWDAIV